MSEQAQILNQRVQSDYLAAYKAKDALRLSVLRLLKAAATNLEVELKRPITDAELLGIILKQAKQREDSIEQFTAGARPDLAAKEEEELAILKDYLPQPLEGEELEAAIKAAMDEAEAALGKPLEARDMGKVMSLLTDKYKGRFDGKVVSALVKSKLS